IAACTEEGRKTMCDLPDQWSSYVRLQAELARGHGSDQRTWRIDDRSWGVEAALNRFIAEQLPVGEELDRTIQSASRRERHRMRHPYVGLSNAALDRGVAV